MHPYDVAIIGGGPAGLAAGIYAARAALQTILLEKGMPGGLAASTELIENYPGFTDGVSGPELMMQMYAQATRFGLKVLSSNVESIIPDNGLFKLKTDDDEIKTKTVILATGAQPRTIGVPGENEFHGRGVSYCATCDGAFFKDKAVAVIGGGDAAVEEALYLTKFARRVHVIHRRDELRAAKILQRRAMDNPKINFQWSRVVKSITGDQTVEKVLLKNVKNGATQNLDVDGVFVYVGTRPVSELVSGLIDIDSNGYIITDEEMRTSIPGLFAAGDIRQKLLRQVVTAVADGAIAAVSAEKHIDNL
ncbi:MAG: thioredoxin-disulfide reductase [Firmicutes bacterium]|nr:thioredoxin-disulfide reductase [Bacillota bacterium]